MATTSIAIQRTFFIKDGTSGNNIPGTLVEAPIRPILTKQCVLWSAGFVFLAGSLPQFQSSALDGAKRLGATIRMDFVRRNKWSDVGSAGFNADIAKDQLAVDTLLINIDKQKQMALQSDRADAIVYQNALNAKSSALSTLVVDGYNALALDWYSNLIDWAKKDKTGATFNRFKAITLADMKLKPVEKLTDILQSLAYEIIRLKSPHSSYINEDKISILVSPEVHRILVNNAGVLGRTTEFIYNSTTKVMRIAGYSIHVDPMLGDSFDGGEYSKTQAALDLKKIHAVICSTRVQFVVLAAFNIDSGRHPVYPSWVGYDSGRIIYGIKENTVGEIKKELFIIREDTTFS